MEILQNFWNLMTTPNEDVINIIAIPFTFIEAYICMKLFTTIFNIKTTSKQQILYIGIFSTISIILKFTTSQSISSYINMIARIFSIYFILKTRFIKALFSEVILFLSSYIMELITLNVLYAFTPITYDDILTVPIYRILCVTIVYISIFLIYKLFEKKEWKINIPEYIHKNKIFIFIVNFLIGLILLGIQIYIFIYYNKVIPMYLLSTNLITLILYFFISIYNVYNTSKLATASADLQEAQLYNKTLSILHDNIRAFKHDFNNIVHAIGGYVQTNDMEGLKKYYSQLYSDCTKSNNLTALSPHVINNPAVYNIFATKYYIADDKGIDINLEVFFDLNQLNMKIYEFTRILRNIIG